MVKEKLIAAVKEQAIIAIDVSHSWPTNDQLKIIGTASKMGFNLAEGAIYNIGVSDSATFKETLKKMGESINAAFLHTIYLLEELEKEEQ